jgi:DHA1 family multidrug resistance protein-like MFS transporter
MGPLVGGFLGTAVGYRMTFVATAVCQILAAFVVMLFVRHSGKVASRSKEATVMGDLRSLLTMPALLGVVAVAFVISFSGGSIQATVPLFVQELNEGGSVAFVVGLIFGLSAVASAISSLITGRLGDMFGQRRVLIGSLAGAALASAPLAFATSSGQLIVGRFIMGLFVGGGLPIVNVLAARLVGPERRAGAIGVAQSAGSIGLAVGPLAGAAVAAAFGLGAPFLMIALAFALAAVWAALVIHPRERS